VELMNKEKICYMPVHQMVEKIRTQELTSLEITEVVIERIKKINPIINAYCTTTFDLARQMAQEADNRVKIGEKLGLLNGIPIWIENLRTLRSRRGLFSGLKT
jgi:Asp-tRNA(Asn)/Glu-tRNA(Gln) amidotransferase A subunit family amidase